MGGVAHAVSNAVSSTVSAAIAPAQAAIDIAKGKNVGQALGSVAAKDVAAATSGTGIVNATPVVGTIVNGVTAGGLNNVERTSQDLQTGLNGGSFGPGSDYLATAKSAAIAGAEVATGGAAAGALGTVGGISAGLGAGKLAGGFLDGGKVDPSAAASVLGDAYGVPDVSGLLGDISGVKNALTPIGGYPANLGPYPVSTPSARVDAPPTAGPDSGALLLIGSIAAVGFLLWKGRKK